MALSITGVDSNGRVTTGTKSTISGGILIPPGNAGIGDLVYKKTSVFNYLSGITPENFKVIGRGKATSSTITVDNVSYTIYGCIYGFVNGMAMVIAPTETSAYWAASGVSCSIGPYYHPTDSGANGKGPIMRNGQRTNYYAQMNTYVNSGYIKDGSSQPVILSSAYQATNLTATTDWTPSNVSTNILAKYGSWNEYIRQTLRVNGAPGTPFGATYVDGTTPVKVHEFGRWMCRKVYESTSTKTNFPAIKYCYEFCENGGVWWLPSMFELGEMMIDEHWDRINDNAAFSGWTVPSRTSYRWSCVRFSSSSAWYFSTFGMSDSYGFSAYQFTVRPVTLLKLV